MARTILAAAIGAVTAIVLAFLIVAVVSAVAGVPTMFEPERLEYGWEGAQYVILLFAFIGVMMIRPFPAIARLGAAVGLLAQRARHRWADLPSLRAQI